jgi:transcriptional regulator with XRE-family HTH domain
MKQDLHNKLSKLMRACGISQSALSRATGVPQPTINRILNESIREPRYDSVVRLAHFFDVTPESMYGPYSLKAGDNTVISSKWLYEQVLSLSDGDRKTLFAKFQANHE